MDGIIIINKEKDYTSHDVVAVVKKILGQKIGHTGTLDPEATGVLPLLVGKATKIAKYLINHDKLYQAVLKLGVKTDTADMTGIVLEKENIRMPQIEQVEEVFFSMIGKIKQIPPMYSAIKINGKKLYEYARQGKKVEVQPREIEIYDLKLNHINSNENEITFTIHCSKGTYIRTICEQIAQKLETIGCMKELKRIQVGEFHIDNSITISKLQQTKNKAGDYIITIEDFFVDKQKVILNPKELEQFLNGVRLPYTLTEDTYRIYSMSKNFIGLGIIKDGFLKRDVVL
ncbi:MAG: tRNA pseudouridine(55) synthase TruB [Clostridia bacterium]|nr:tRNA pseudouridine(55) synthase TruB [Clostridia bacterium]